MVFNSFEFALFFLVLFLLYLASNHKWQNRILLLGSYIFYGWWDWRFLTLIFLSTVIDFFCGLKIYSENSIKLKKVFLYTSIFFNLGILCVFKYFNFFLENFYGLLDQLGLEVNSPVLKIVLPMGISFYTFQTMSYSLDIFRGKLKPTRKFLDFSLFVVFFPQLVAGPIERAKRLLPQILFPRKITLPQFYEGSWLIFYGLFMKIFVADNLASLVDQVYSSHNSSQNGPLIILATYAFAFQIYCDFAGYSNIARGLGKCMGFHLMVNFKTPSFSTSPQEFWRRWHISFSTWLRDYLYIPLGGNRGGSLFTLKNLLITMLLGGLWHGAAWNFVLWGFYQGILIFAFRTFHTNKKETEAPSWKKILKMVFFFHLTCLGWFFFRASSFEQIIDLGTSVFLNFQFSMDILPMTGQILLYCLPLLFIDFYEYKRNNINFIFSLNPLLRSLIYFILLSLLLLGGAPGGKEFIYFQF